MSKGKGTGTAPTAAREVIQDWADGEGGYTFERGRMESAVRNICFDNPASLPSELVPKPTGKLNKEDVDFISKELMVPRRAAEQALAGCGGDVAQALKGLMIPK